MSATYGSFRKSTSINPVSNAETVGEGGDGASGSESDSERSTAHLRKRGESRVQGINKFCDVVTLAHFFSPESAIDILMILVWKDASRFVVRLVSPFNAMVSCLWLHWKWLPFYGLTDLYIKSCRKLNIKGRLLGRAPSTIIGSLQLSALLNISPRILIWRLFRVSFHLSSQAAMPS